MQFDDYVEFPSGYQDKQSFDTLEEMEEALMRIRSMNKKLDWYKNLKRTRVQSIEDNISKTESQLESMNELIKNTMKKLCPNEKTIHFPSVAKVTKRSLKPDVVIEDEAKLLEHLDDLGLRSSVMVQKEEFSKTNAKNVVKELLKDERVTSVPGTKIETDRESLSISFEKDEDEPSEEEVQPKAKAPAKKSKAMSEMIV